MVSTNAAIEDATVSPLGCLTFCSQDLNALIVTQVPVFRSEFKFSARSFRNFNLWFPASRAFRSSIEYVAITRRDKESKEASDSLQVDTASEITKIVHDLSA